MVASGYVLEDLLILVILLFFVFVLKFHKTGYIGETVET